MGEIPAFAGMTDLGIEPNLEIRVDAFGERDEFVVLVDGVAYQRY